MRNSTCQVDVEKLIEKLEVHRLILDSIHNGIMVTDAEGYITHFNKPYGQFLGMKPEEQIGKHCTEVIENTRMQIVAKTGKAEISQLHRINGQDMVVHRIPIRKDGKVIAVFGQVMFKDVRDVHKLANRLSVLESKVRLYEEELINLRSTRYTFESIIGRSKAVNDLKKEALQATANPFPVLITGESGTGKELFAQAIHHTSHRKLYPFVRINCAAIPKDLLESELFGYEKGAFTGARTSGKPGKFELAHHGTIFLDEIGDLPLSMQPKLLRVLEEKEFERIGGTSIIKTDFRLIAATNQNLEDMLDKNLFRKDLFYRLNVISIQIPPLRERRRDIIPTAMHMLDLIVQDAGLPPITIDPKAAALLKRHDWPGNAREIGNVLERTVSYLEGNMIYADDLPPYLYSKLTQKMDPDRPSLKHAQDQAERETIRRALHQTGYNKSQAARRLGIHRSLLYKKMRKYHLPLKMEADLHYR